MTRIQPRARARTEILRSGHEARRSLKWVFVRIDALLRVTAGPIDNERRRGSERSRIEDETSAADWTLVAAGEMLRTRGLRWAEESHTGR
jgi:hypothetical protein